MKKFEITEKDVVDIDKYINERAKIKIEISEKKKIRFKISKKLFKKINNNE